MCSFDNAIVRARALLAVATASMLVACGTGSTSPTDDTTAAVRDAAVRLLTEDGNATALPKAYRRQVLLRRMSRYVASGALERRVDVTVAAIRKVGGRRYVQPWSDSITVGDWEATEVEGRRATVIFVGYEALSGMGLSGSANPLQRFTVEMSREDGRWKLIDYTAQWLGPEGPVGESGERAIEELPLRIVYRNPRPAR